MIGSVRLSMPERRERVLALVLVGLCAAVYANSLANGFAFDDVWIVQRNPRVHGFLDGISLSDLRRIWLAPYWPQNGEMLGLYRPLTIFAFAIEWAIGGGAAWVFHAVNVALQAVVTVLGFAVLRRLVGSSWAAFFGAAVFAVHPLHTEVVANIVGQAELLAAAGVLAACWVHLARPPGDRGAAVTMGLLYALAMLAKEHAIVLPALLLGLDLARRDDVPGPRAFRRWIGWAGAYLYENRRRYAYLAVAALAFLLLRVAVLGSVAGTDAGPQLPFLKGELRLLTAFRAWPEYVRLLFFPATLSADYSPGVILPVESLAGMALLGMLILVAVLVLAATTPWKPEVGLGAYWFFIAALPTSNLILPVGVILAERTLFLASFGLSILAAYAWRHAAAHVAGARRVALAAAAGLGIVALGWKTVARNPDWADTQAVMTALIREHPEAYRAQWNLAMREFEAGDLDASAYHWELAYRVWPYDAQFLTDYSAFLMTRGRTEDAIGHLREALRLMPQMMRARNNIAIAYLQTRRFPEAVAAIDSLFAYLGPHPQLFELRARALTGLQSEEAVPAWRAAFRAGMSPGWVQWALYARALGVAGDTAAALTALDSAAVLAGVLGDSTAERSVARARDRLLTRAREDGGPPAVVENSFDRPL